MKVYRCDLCNEIHDEIGEMNTLELKYAGQAHTIFFKDGFYHLCSGCTSRLIKMLKEADEKRIAKAAVKVEAKAPETAKPAKSKLDNGKILALRNAGWSLEKIANEMGCCPQTIANRLEAIKENRNDK